MGTFRNFGFETDSITGWTKGGGTWPGGSAPMPSAYLPGGSLYAASAAEITTTSTGLDARTGNQLSAVYDGAHAVMINSPAANGSVSVLTQQISNFTGSSLSFAYAGVLQQSHDTGEADGFSIALTDRTTGDLLFETTFDSRTARNTFTLSSSGWYYQNWQTVTVDTGALRGHDLELTVIAWDCSLGGHSGYVYLDGFDLVTGSVSGRLFHDYDASGVRDAGEPALSGWTVYADADEDGIRDAGEASTVTDARGRYLLNGVPVGEAVIRVDLPAGSWEAWLAPGLTVAVAEDATTAGIDFAVTGGATPLDDSLSGDQDAETIDALGGNDVVLGNRGNDTLAGGAGDDEVRGGRDDDLIDGGKGDDDARGSDGVDRIDGGDGNDRVSGGEGDDSISGGAGADRLKGGAGTDVFGFDGAFGMDIVIDFASADGDTLAISVVGVADLNDLVLTQRRDDTIVTLAAGGGEEIVLRNVLATTLTADDFSFAPPETAALVPDPGLAVLA